MHLGSCEKNAAVLVFCCSPDTVIGALLSGGVNIERLNVIFRAFPIGDRLVSNGVLSTSEYSGLWQRHTKSFDSGDTFKWLLNVIEAKSNEQKSKFIIELRKEFMGAFRKGQAVTIGKLLCVR